MNKPLAFEGFGLGRLFCPKQKRQQQVIEFDARVKANIKYEAVQRNVNEKLELQDEIYQSLGIYKPDLGNKIKNDWFDVDLYLLDYGYDITRELV